MKKFNWLMRRWQEFRWGHSTYLTFFISFLNFILITYRFLIDYVPFLKSLFPRLSIYTACTLLVYIPLAVAIGHIHRKRQLKITLAMTTEQDPYIMEILNRVRKIEELLEKVER